MITAKEIHQDFYSAEERLLKEAKELIKNPKVEKVVNAERFSKLGFTSCKEVKEAGEIVNKQAKCKETVSVIKYFRQNYPFQKFITEAEVKRLCEKYHLVLGDCSDYIGDIPEKNLIEIEGFKLKEGDYRERISFYGLTLSMDWRLPKMRYNDVTGSIEFVSTGEPESPKVKEEKLEMYKPDFKICAPLKDFDNEAMEVREGYKLSPKDPIVLQPVSKDGVEGYLIITAWGDEASDEIVVNEINN